VEIIINGRVERRLPVEEVMKSGALGTIEFKESGWFLVRAITEDKKTFRFASTAPFYVEISPAKERISRASAEFFLEWTRQRIGRVMLDDLDQRKEVLVHHFVAEKFWRDRVNNANAE